MIRYQRGDLEAYAQLAERHLPGVYGIALSLARESTAAETLTLGVFAELTRRAGDFRDNAPFSTWLYRLAVGAPVHTIGTAANAGNEAALPESLAWVGILPDAQRTVFLLKQVAGLAFHQIADIIGTDVQEAKARMQKALLSIHKAVQERRAAGDTSRRTSEH